MKKNKFKGFDKQIYFIKIILGDFCPLRCSYCFVDKTNKKVIKKETLKNFIDLLLYSPGRNKLLHLLGGEPLLFWDKIEYGVKYARNLAKKLGKDLDISFCTTGLYFNEEKLKFINDMDIYLAWSIDGPKEIHDLNRKTIKGKGTFNDVISKKEIVFKNIKDSHLGIAMTIDQNTVDSLVDSYKYLIDKEKFNCTINIAPVDGFKWKKEKEKKFIESLVEIHDYIFEQIEKGRFLFLNSLNKEFRFNMLSVFRNKGRCLWFYTEAFYTGEVLFNPFVNKEEDYSKFVVGNINNENFLNEINKYIGCKFDNKSKKCLECRENYFNPMFNNDLEEVYLNKLLKYRDKISILYANKIMLRAKTEDNFKKYIEIAKDMMYV